MCYAPGRARGRAQTTVPRPSPPLRTALFVLLALHLIFPLLWLMQWAEFGPRPNDWLHLKIVADHFVGGDWTHLYSAAEDSINPGYLWRYPPFALYLVAPLAWLPAETAYAVLVGIEVVALAVSLAVLFRLSPPPMGTTHLWILAIVTSAPVLSTLIAGQSSALILLVVVVAARVWTSGHVLWACAILGLLAVKPNWGLFFGAYAIAIREWRGAAAMLAVAVGLCVAALPLGADLWIDFARLSVLNDAVLAEYETFKVITLRGFLTAVMGPGQLTIALWLLCAVTVAMMLRRYWPVDRQPANELGMILLAAVALNPYASFYDALVLAMPATVWWAGAMWATTSWRAIGGLVAVIWCWEHYLYTWPNLWQGADWVPSPAFSIVGPAAAIWLLLTVRHPVRNSAYAA